MKTKKFLGTFIFILSLLIVSQQQFSIPNQEIVVQFANDEVTSIEVQHTITIVKKQLQAIGVDHIQVHKSTNGGLIISYFSDVDVASIKKIISEENELQLGVSTVFQKDTSNKTSSKEKSNTYKLEVYKIKKGDDTEKDLNGLALELKPEVDRFYKPNVFFLKIEIDVWETKRTEKVAYSIQRTIAAEIDNSSHNIPEVRAGPNTTITS